MCRYTLLCLISTLTALGQTPETALLGGPCLAEDTKDFVAIQTWSAHVSRQLEASRRGDWVSAFEAAKLVVRGKCSNEFWWLRLAESAMQANRPADAVRALDLSYARKINGIRERLDDPKSPLHVLPATATYRKSQLASKLERDRHALEKRRAEARARMAVEPRPPEAYIAKPACPFECCAFGTWSVERGTDLYDTPNGTRIVGRAVKGEKVQALTGEAHLRPRPVWVRSEGPVPAGSVVYLLDYLGEGWAHIWHKGKIAEADVAPVIGECTSPGRFTCWGEFVSPEDKNWARDAVWWVKVKTHRGSVGWTRQSGNFRGADRCA